MLHLIIVILSYLRSVGSSDSLEQQAIMAQIGGANVNIILEVQVSLAFILVS